MSDCITPEERQEVAERLRHLTPSKQVYPDYTPLYTDICAAIGGKKDPWFGILALAERLADLIDPTCHMEPNYVSQFSDDPQWFTCDKCGNDTEQLENYCPYCGARVAQDEAQ